MQVSHTYHFDFEHPVQKLLSVVADTVRWGEAAGFPKYRVREDLQPDGSVRVTGSIDVYGFTVSWEELPADWIFWRSGMESCCPRSSFLILVIFFRKTAKGASVSSAISNSFSRRF